MSKEKNLEKYFKGLLTDILFKRQYKPTITIQSILTNIEEQLADDLNYNLNREFKKWVKKVKEKTSDKIPKKFIGRKRPQHRLFPYMVSEDLNTKIYTNLEVTYKPFKVLIRGSFNLDSPHSTATNFGFTPKGIGTSKGRWVGWTDRVFKNKSYDGVKGAEHIVHDEIKKELAKLSDYF